ncbi:MAG: AI-2E family transporter [Anaerolineaceae bacterium]|nr:AI-2E family transporter [Anaerolineaceae bacterium]MDD4578483.1 AI-2E family transporter [Anaerolineaceae bacterium]
METTEKNASTDPTEDLDPVFEKRVDSESSDSKNSDSPPWGWGTKLIVGTLLVAGFLALVFRFNDYFKLVLTAFVLSFLLYPISKFLLKTFRIKWRVAVAIVYILVASLLIWLLARGGVGLATQVQNLFQTVIDNVDNITELLDRWSSQTINIGPFDFTTPQLDFELIGQWISNQLEPIASQAGTIATTVVGRVGGFLVNAGITYIVSFFITSESEGAKRRMLNITIPGYEKDSRRLGMEIGKIFNSFIRGEFTVVSIAIIVYSIFLGVMGLPYFFVLALIAGLGRFIPYLGAALGWISFFIGALLQDPTPFGLTKVVYALLIVGIAVVIDTIFDQVLMPKVMGNSLEVHPAAIMISALVGAQLMGVLGVILAAPAFATVKLILRYSSRKLFDRDPWEGMQYYQKPNESVLIKGLRKIWEKISSFLEKPWRKIKDRFGRLFRSVEKKANKNDH